MIDYKKKYIKYKKKYLNLNGGKKIKKSKIKKSKIKKSKIKKIKKVVGQLDELSTPEELSSSEELLTPQELLTNKLSKLSVNLPNFSDEDINIILNHPHFGVIEEMSIEELQDRLGKTNNITPELLINIFNSQPPPCISVKKTTLEKRITEFICKRGDVCCLDDLPKNKVIKALFKTYKKTFENETPSHEYLNWLYNDITGLIPTKLCHYNQSEKVVTIGNKIAEDINKILDIDNNEKDETVLINKLTNLLKQLPLFYLLGLLGYHITINM